MTLFARWIKGKEGGKPALSNYDLKILRVAAHYHLSPDAAEEMSEDWFNKPLILMEADSMAFKLK